MSFDYPLDNYSILEINLIKANRFQHCLMNVNGPDQNGFWKGKTHETTHWMSHIKNIVFVFYNAKAYSNFHVDSIIEQTPPKMFTNCIDISCSCI